MSLTNHSPCYLYTLILANESTPLCCVCLSVGALAAIAIIISPGLKLKQHLFFRNIVSSVQIKCLLDPPTLEAGLVKLAATPDPRVLRDPLIPTPGRARDILDHLDSLLTMGQGGLLEWGPGLRWSHCPRDRGQEWGHQVERKE